jgi:hypothetical protein
MKYICLGYLEPGIFERMAEDERNAVLDACFTYDDHLRANGHRAVGEALQPAETALTVDWKNGKSPRRTVPTSKPRNSLAASASSKRAT